MRTAIMMMGWCSTRGARVMLEAAIHTTLRHDDRRCARHAGDAVVHGARMQRRWFLLNHEGPRRKGCGNCATTREPPHAISTIGCGRGHRQRNASRSIESSNLEGRYRPLRSAANNGRSTADRPSTSSRMRQQSARVVA
jgi:hypothetical protein